MSHDAPLTATMTPLTRPRWPLTEAAQRCGVSRSTIRRYREAGRFPNAEKKDGSWVIPIEDLLGAGLNPTAPTTLPEPEIGTLGSSAHNFVSRVPDPAQEIPDLAVRVIQLEADLRVEQAHRAAAEQIAAERGRLLDVAHSALLALEASPARPPASTPPQPHIPPVEEVTPLSAAPARRRWFSRR